MEIIETINTFLASFSTKWTYFYGIDTLDTQAPERSVADSTPTGLIFTLNQIINKPTKYLTFPIFACKIPTPAS